MKSFTCISIRTGIFLILALVVEAGEYCTNYDTGQTDYCSGYCCSTEDDSCCSDWGWIAGVVVGCIVFIAIVGTIIFLVCQKMNAKKAPTVHVQMSNNQHTSFQSNNRNTRRQPNYNNQNAMYTNMSANTYLPPPPPYSQTYTPAPAYNPNPSYPAPPPYPGSPMPGSNVYSGGNNAFQPPPQTQMTSHAQNTGDIAYPPPPVS
ncbi:cysteine and tyrosine-rich protein 1-like [Mercenaria mercenaria]|uniref:cysteine and tyrosine-rich protein 1-like n=1 Tax=Mercenaria mercenaria TaxID=6596 RepID=UPI00234E6450|nr:cysteine and tyrosine-rich protein 1-like [Mercenaria mercenaria]